MYALLIKPFFDFTFAIILIVLLSPLYIIVYFIIFSDLKENPFFVQKRPGYLEKVFKIRKFKTMDSGADSNGVLLSDKVRLTKLGTILRKLSIDELPQLFNIIKGEMSFVGPRPLLVGYLPLYNKTQARRHEVKPGITGWAQVNGRNAISWEKKFELDVWYVDNQSFLLDMKILWMTFLKVVRRDGISSGTSVTMEKFKGSK